MSAARTPVADIVAPDRTGPGRRRHAWLRAGCVFLVLLIYLCWWTTYAMNGLSAYGRYRQLEPGQPSAALGAEFRLTNLVQTAQLLNSSSGEVSSPEPNTVWVVADVEVVRTTESEYFYCSFKVLGPDRRLWEKNSGYVSRETSSFCEKESMPLGKPVQVEAIFQIPIRYVDQVAGVTVSDGGSREARLVLVPPR